MLVTVETTLQEEGVSFVDDDRDLRQKKSQIRWTTRRVYCGEGVVGRWTSNMVDGENGTRGGVSSMNDPPFFLLTPTRKNRSRKGRTHFYIDDRKSVTYYKNMSYLINKTVFLKNNQIYYEVKLSL